MIDIDGCLIHDDKIIIEEKHKNVILLMSLYQFYICFEGTVYTRYNFTETNKKYIIDKIKEKTTFFTVETKEEYKKIFNEINVKGNVFREHYRYLNHYYKDFNGNENNVKFDDILNKLFSESKTDDGKLTIPKFKSFSFRKSYVKKKKAKKRKEVKNEVVAKFKLSFIFLKI
jgi:hypothetical protein